LEDVDHVFGLLGQNILPGNVGDIFEPLPESIVVVLPADAFEDGIGVWERRQLEFWGLRSRSDFASAM
jgi:hypothetical protein